jgi:hypothetical protein
LIDLSCLTLMHVNPCITSLEMMNDSDGILDAAKDALDAHGKIPPKDKKKRILPLTEPMDALRVRISDARKAEQVCAAQLVSRVCCSGTHGGAAS